MWTTFHNSPISFHAQGIQYGLWHLGFIMNLEPRSLCTLLSSCWGALDRDNIFLDWASGLNSALPFILYLWIRIHGPKWIRINITADNVLFYYLKWVSLPFEKMRILEGEGELQLGVQQPSARQRDLVRSEHRSGWSQNRVVSMKFPAL